MDKKFKFDISLSVLNHLGRNLYRNIITVLGEAISNSWDADAFNVKIRLDRKKNNMYILDDGNGMTEEDFQNKFLKVGYSKRSGKKFTSDLGRPFIGRKGIGKLALLSCAKKIHILTKTSDSKIIGGCIDNSKLDEAIDENSSIYDLDLVDMSLKKYFDGIEKGTLLFFEDVSASLYHTDEYLKKAIALSFKFSLIDSSFNIFYNDEKIDEKCLSKLAENTQFIWKIGDCKDAFIDSMKKLEYTGNLKTNMKMSGYIATVKKPGILKNDNIEKISLDLFVNGRLREKDILKHFPSSRIVENYVYGQIHFNQLDLGDCKDIFTSSREGIVSDSKEFNDFIEEVKRLFSKVIEDWDKYRRKAGDAGDPDNKSITPVDRKMEEYINTSIKEMKKSANTKNNTIFYQWLDEITDDAKFNVSSYAECFIAENLIRKYILHKNITLNEECINEINKFKSKENQNKTRVNIAFPIREKSMDLSYLGMDKLAKTADSIKDPNVKFSLTKSAEIYKPIRDAMAHTSILSSAAKSQLNAEYENIKSQLVINLSKLK